MVSTKSEPMACQSQTIAEKVLSDHLVEGNLTPGERISISVDQALLHDVLGPLIWMEFEALEFDEVQTEVAVQHCDHQSLQIAKEDSDTHQYLETATRRFGAYFSKPGTGICHQVQRENWIKPGATLVGCDSHGPTMGGFGAIGIGAGGLDVAAAMGGDTYEFEMPEIVEVKLKNELNDWASAKDVILELLRRLSMKGGVDKIFEFTGPGVETLSVPERCTIANMTTELGATSAIFPSDTKTRQHLRRLGREDDFKEISPDENATYDESLEVDLESLVPLIAKPSMPDNVVPVSEVEGTTVDQCIVGTCTNGSYFDIATVAETLKGRKINPETDFIVSPASKRSIEQLTREGLTTELYAAGASVTKSTCGACLGQGHIPATDTVSLRAFNRNFKGRSGNPDDSVYLCSPEVVAVSAIEGEITDPRKSDIEPPSVSLPEDLTQRSSGILEPDPTIEIKRGETIGTIPLKDPLKNQIEGPVLTKAGDDITTDHIVPGDPEVLSLWSDPQACADYTLTRVDEQFPEKARDADGGWIIAGENWGQGSARENAALELAVLGLDGVLAKSFARIHFENLVNFGILPLEIPNSKIYDRISPNDTLRVVGDVTDQIKNGDKEITMSVNNDWEFTANISLTQNQRETILAGGKLPQLKDKK